MANTISAFIELGKAVIKAIPLALLGGSPATGIFWVFTALVFMQYRRVEATENRIYGVVKNRSMTQALKSIGWGLVGGCIASLLLVFLGIPLSDSGLAYLFPVALALMLVSPRFMCFSYSGGLISLSYLIFGFPRVNVPTIMALVGVLHLTESLLIYLSGAGCATPFFVRNKRNEVVGGFGVQRFWPMPLIAVFLMSKAAIPSAGEWIPTPDWWPLLGLKEAALANTNFFYALFPVAAGLGYGDISVTTLPRERASTTARILSLYSVVLLVVSVAAASFRKLEWVAALFGPVAHEFIARMGANAEMTGEPRFVRPAEGVMVLDVLPGSAAGELHIESSDVVLEVNGRKVNSRDEMRAALEETPEPLEMVVRSGGRAGRERLVRLGRVVTSLGIISVPEPGDDIHVEFRTTSPLRGLVRRLASFLGFHRRG